MCERFNLRVSSIDLAAIFGLEREPGPSIPRFNIGPMQRILTIRAKMDGLRVPELMQWGLVPGWAKDPSIGVELINAPANLLFNSSSFRAALRRRRCLIPATGFYDWVQVNPTTKQTLHIFPKDGQPIAFAGLWERWRASDRTTLASCTIITTEVHRFSRGLQTRTPVVIAKDKWDSWLNPEQDYSPDLAKLLDPCFNSGLEKNVVSDYVNHLRNDSPECIRPVLSSHATS